MLMGLFLSGLLATSALMISRLLIDQKKGMKVAQSNDESEELHQIIYTLLVNSDSCKTTLDYGVIANNIDQQSGSTFINLFKDNLTNINIYEIHRKPEPNPLDDSKVIALGASNAPARIGFGTNSASFVESKLIKSIILSPMKNTDPGIRNLEINYSKHNSDSSQSGLGMSLVKKVIPLRVKMKPDGRFDSCYAIASNDWSGTNSRNDLPKKMCEELSFFLWDDLSSTCKLNLKCPDGEIYSGIKPDGSVECRKLQDLVDYNQVLDNSSTTCPIGHLVSFKIDTPTNKVSISCVPPPPPVNCDGQWGPCENNCQPSFQTYRIARAAEYGGTPCPVAHGATKVGTCTRRRCSIPPIIGLSTKLISATLVCNTACNISQPTIPWCFSTNDRSDYYSTDCSASASCSNCCKYDYKFSCDFVPGGWVHLSDVSSACVSNASCTKTSLSECTLALNGSTMNRTTCETGIPGCVTTLEKVMSYRCDYTP